MKCLFPDGDEVPCRLMDAQVNYVQVNAVVLYLKNIQNWSGWAFRCYKDNTSFTLTGISVGKENWFFSLNRTDYVIT